MTWKIKKIVKSLPKLNNPVLVEGLPGIGNVGKVAVDFIIDELKAKKAYDFFSYSFPHSVFVNEKNLVELPSIELYYKRFGKKKYDLLLLTGDVQPIDEVSSYEFCDKILDIFKELNGKEIITLGGIGLAHAPKQPKLYCTGNSRDIIKRYKKGTALNDKLYGVVGPIVGVSGLLLGLAGRRNINAVSLLAETMGHPMYLGVKGAREILKVLDKKLSLNIDISQLDKEIKEVESEILKQSSDLSSLAKRSSLKRLAGKLGKEEMTYIG